MRLRLKKLIRGDAAQAVRMAIELCPEPVAVVDGAGRLLVGEAIEDPARSFGITVNDQHLGEVLGGEGADAIAALVRHLVAREREKVQLANETLGRYKELTLLYDLSDRLSRMFDVNDVAQTVVDEALRAVGGHQSALYIHDMRMDALVALAMANDSDTARLPARSGVEGRVLRTGQAEFVEEIDTDLRTTLDQEIRSVICAPIRSGERVVGVLRLAHNQAGRWDSGDLKLVSSLAAQAAAALQGAELYRNRMRTVALRHNLERYVSPNLLAAARQSTDSPEGGLALLFCDLSQSGEMDELELLLTRATSSMLEQNAVVDLPQGQMLLAAIADRQPELACQRAVEAGVVLSRQLADVMPGIGISCLPLRADADTFAQAISTAALLQAASEGRLLVDYDVAAALHSTYPTEQVDDVDLPTERAVFEVRP